MNKPSDKNKNKLRDKIIGLGEKSIQKSYFPQLKDRIRELEESKTSLEEKSLQLQNLLYSLEEERLRAIENEARYKNLFDYSNDAIFIHDLEGNIIDANKKSIELFGYRKEELLKLNISDLHPESALEVSRQAFSKINKDGFIRFEIAFKKKDGSTFQTEVSSNIYDVKGQKCIQGIVRDITNRKRLEEEMIKSEKLESIGLLAGGIAHDFNNYLTTIIGNLSLAKLEAKDNNELQDILEMAEKASIRAADLTRQLLTFSRGGKPIKKTAMIQEVIRDAANFALHGSSVKIKYDFENQIYPVDFDEGQISQVINNIVINAIHSMISGGEIEISCRNVSFDKENRFKWNEGNYVEIAVTDEGDGIPEDILSKIFDPFFTTKSGGTGLGLSTSYSIIKRHGGYLRADSQQGVGSTFYIYMPASKNKYQKIKRDNRTFDLSFKKIMVIDDDETIRSLIKNGLAKYGCVVIEASNGTEALKMYAQMILDENSVDAVIIDLTIPGDIGGKAIIEQMLKLDPHVRAIVSSGYSNDPVMADFDKYGFKARLQKPYKVRQLIQTVDKVLEESDIRIRHDQ